MGFEDAGGSWCVGHCGRAGLAAGVVSGGEDQFRLHTDVPCKGEETRRCRRPGPYDINSGIWIYLEINCNYSLCDPIKGIILSLIGSYCII